VVAILDTFGDWAWWLVTILVSVFLLFGWRVFYAEAYDPLLTASVFRDDVVAWGAYYLPTVRPSLLGAQVHQESQWKAAARSRVGARGLLQIMPETAKDIALRCGLPSFDPLIPDQAIRGGICYDSMLWKELQKLITQWIATNDDHWDLTARSYNGGIKYVLREAALLDQEHITARRSGLLANVCLRFRSAASCKENTEYPLRIRRVEQLFYVGWN
jgi:hypothetical protein